MASAPEVGDEWDFYLCDVDGAPASIVLNLWFERHAPLSSADTLYVVRIAMRDRAEHGMASPAEAALLRPIENRISEGALATGLFYVGRVRSEGLWLLIFYGPAGREDALQATPTTTDMLDGRALEIRTMADPDWGYYRDFMLPDAERRRWIEDRRVVEALQERGDVPTIARRVNHWAFFPTAAARDRFVGDAAHERFVVASVLDDAEGELAFGAQVHRVDTVDVEHIHDVVMSLVELAEQHGGAYDGWETSVEK